jgi:hypothetical protein
MTRKHFQEFAEMARRMRGKMDATAHVALVTELAGVCARFNPSFDRVRFFDACGYTLHGEVQ